MVMLNICNLIRLKPISKSPRKFTTRVICVSEENGIIANASVDGLIRLYTLKNLQNNNNNSPEVFNKPYINDFCSEVVLEAHENQAIWSLALHTNENLLQSCSSDYKVKCSKFLRQQERVMRHRESGTNFECGKSIVTSLAWSQKLFTQFYCGTAGQQVLVYDLNVVNPIQKMGYSGLQVNSIKAAFDKPAILCACEDGVVRQFDCDGNKLVNNFTGHTDSICGLSMSRNGNNFVTGGHDGKICLWDLRKAQLVCQLDQCHYKKYDEVIHSVLFLDDFNCVVSAGADGDINFWEIV